LSLLVQQQEPSRRRSRSCSCSDHACHLSLLRTTRTHTQTRTAQHTQGTTTVVTEIISLWRIHIFVFVIQMLYLWIRDPMRLEARAGLWLSGLSQNSFPTMRSACILFVTESHCALDCTHCAATASLPLDAHTPLL
jgi:hypothetical protein